MPIHAKHMCVQIATQQGYDAARGYLCGTMTASDVPMSNDPIVTFWEGGMCCCWIGRTTAYKHAAVVTSTTLQHRGGGQCQPQLSHRKMERHKRNRHVPLGSLSRVSAIASASRKAVWAVWVITRLPLHLHALEGAGVCVSTRTVSTDHCRWVVIEVVVEVDSKYDSTLFYTGFYYVALKRATGRIEGFYFDRTTSPFQKLELEPCGSDSGVAGINCATYELC